jgi:hypothetical protein
VAVALVAWNLELKEEETLLNKFLISVYYFLCFQEKTSDYLLQQNYKEHGYVPAKNTMKSTIHTPMPTKHQSNVRQATTFRALQDICYCIF